MRRETHGKVLLVASTRWVSTARLAMALDSVGCVVELYGAEGHPAMSTGLIACHHLYLALKPLENLRKALWISRPDLLVMVDECSSLLIGELEAWLRDEHAQAELAHLHQLLQRSFGSVEGLQALNSRIDVLRAAQAVGVAIPQTLPVGSAEDAAALPRQMPGPWLL